MVKCTKLNSYQGIQNLSGLPINVKSKQIKKETTNSSQVKESFKQFWKEYQENRQLSKKQQLQQTTDESLSTNESLESEHENTFPIFNGKFKLLKQLGEGGTSKVFLAQSIKTEKKYAIKIIKSDFLSASECQINVIKNEIVIQRNLSHSNMVQLVDQGCNGVIVNTNGTQLDNLVYLILEYANGGLLFDLVKENNDKGFGEEPSKFLFSQLVDFLEYIHARGITHRDMKLENVLFDNEMNLKVTDFGAAETKNISKPEHLIGTLSYMAPEIFAKKTYDGRPVDVFALGVLLSIIVKGTMPFRVAKIEDGYYRMLVMEKYDEYWAKIQATQYSSEFKDLMQQMLHYDPSKRPSIEQIQKHPWLIKKQNTDISKQQLIQMSKSSEQTYKNMEITKI